MDNVELLKRIEDLERRIGLRVFKLYYTRGTNQEDKLFYFDGGLRDAIQEGRRHCSIMNFRFVAVRPGLVDLRHQEKLKLSDPEWSTDQDERNHTSYSTNTVKMTNVNAELLKALNNGPANK
jgi:hypothetical protein